MFYIILHVSITGPYADPDDDDVLKTCCRASSVRASVRPTHNILCCLCRWQPPLNVGANGVSYYCHGRYY